MEVMATGVVGLVHPIKDVCIKLGGTQDGYICRDIFTLNV